MITTTDSKAQRVWIVLICAILLLFSVSFITYGRIDTLVPTGNVDIFDINIDCNCKDDTICPNCSCPSNSLPVVTEIKDSEKVEVSKEPEIEKEGLVEVEDEIDKFQNQSELRIFENPAYRMENKIAPGDENAYQFLVRNNNEFDIKYKISLVEENPYNVNLKYKLKLNDEYILGSEEHWLSHSEINTSLLDLDSLAYDNYILEWKWVDSTNDTEAGISNASYKLHIDINAEAKEA